MLVPREDQPAEAAVNTRLEAIETATLHEIEAELPEAKRRLVVPEIGAQDHAHELVSQARGVAVAMLEAPIHHAPDDETVQVRVGEHDRRRAGDQHLERGALVGIGQQRQVDELLDRARPQLSPHAIVLLADQLVRRPRGPVDTDALQVLEAHLEGVLEPVEGREERYLQADDVREIREVTSAARRRREPLLRSDGVAGEELALGAMKLEGKGERVAALPAALFQERAPAARYVSADAWAVDRIARLPARRSSSAVRSRSASDEISAAPRLS